MTYSATVRPLNARSLVLSVLLGLRPPELSAAALVRLGALFGIAEGTVRTALSRMLAAGELTGGAEGYRLAGRQLERKAAQDIGRHGPPPGWDGSWVTALVTTPRRDSTERRAFRTRMANLRMGELRPDAWLRPANLPGTDTELAADGMVVVRGPLSGDRPDALARRLWPLERIATEATDLDRRLQAALPIRVGATDLAAGFTLAAEVVRFLRAEPLLPPELRPPGPWAPDALRATYRHFDREFGEALLDALGNPVRASRRG